MRTLQFRVSGQRLEAVNIPTDLVKGTRNYLQCAFSFEGSDWNGCKVVAEFGGGYAVPVVNQICMIPDEAAARQYFKLHLIGVRDSYLITTNEVVVKQGVN